MKPRGDHHGLPFWYVGINQLDGTAKPFIIEHSISQEVLLTIIIIMQHPRFDLLSEEDAQKALKIIEERHRSLIHRRNLAQENVLYTSNLMRHYPSIPHWKHTHRSNEEALKNIEAKLADIEHVLAIVTK